MKFRIVYFTPDPFRGDRFAVGAMVRDGRGMRFRRAAQIPGPECLGSRQSWATLQMVLDNVGALDSLEEIAPGYASQLVSFSPPKEIPAGVEDPDDWVERVFLTRSGPAAPRATRPQRERRDVYGRRLFEHWQVDRYVRNRFDFSALVPRSVEAVEVSHHPTHWVLGREKVLLMEPLIGTRPSFDADLKDVAQSFLAQQRLFQIDAAEAPYAPEYLAYVFSNGYRGAVSEAKQALHRAQVNVVDVEDQRDCARLIQRVRDVGSSFNLLQH